MYVGVTASMNNEEENVRVGAGKGAAAAPDFALPNDRPRSRRRKERPPLPPLLRLLLR